MAGTVSTTRPLVSTIIPVFNRTAMLREAVASVLAQTYRPIEIIIVDDGSTDGTAAAADALATEHPDIIRVIHQPNGGVGRARETGRQAARGEYVQYLDSDDLLLPRKFELQVAALEARPECVQPYAAPHSGRASSAAYGWTRWRYSDGSTDPRPSKRTGDALETMFPAMLEARIWETATPLYRAPVLAEAGPWLPLNAEEDWEMDARVAARGVRLAYCPEWIAEHRRHHEGHLSGHATPELFRDRAAAHASIYASARRAGITSDAPEMQHFARELFLLSRQCGAAGLARESRQLFELAREAAGPGGARLQFRLYAQLARLAGWSTMGKASAVMDRLRSFRGSPS